MAEAGGMIGSVEIVGIVRLSGSPGSVAQPLVAQIQNRMTLMLWIGPALPLASRLQHLVTVQQAQQWLALVKLANLAMAPSGAYPSLTSSLTSSPS